MLNVPVPFPYQNSVGYLVPNADRPTAERVRIVQHKEGGEVLVAREVPEGGREARLRFYNRGATRQLTVQLDEIKETPREAAAFSEPAKLTPHQREQLALLAKLGGGTRETAVAVMADRRLNPGTLSRLHTAGLTAQADLPYRGDTRRRVSHYWLTGAGLRAIARAAR